MIQQVNKEVHNTFSYYAFVHVFVGLTFIRLYKNENNHITNTSGLC